MTQKIVSEEEVKKILNIESFRNLSKDKVMEFISLIPDMDKEVAISIINQFPNYVDLAKQTTESFNETRDNCLEKNDNSRRDVVDMYRTILNSQARLLEKEDLSEAQQRYATEQMFAAADKVAEKDTENKAFYVEVMKYGTYLTTGILMIGGVILGVNFSQKLIHSN